MRLYYIPRKLLPLKIFQMLNIHVLSCLHQRRYIAFKKSILFFVLDAFLFLRGRKYVRIFVSSSLFWRIADVRKMLCRNCNMSMLIPLKNKLFFCDLDCTYVYRRQSLVGSCIVFWDVLSIDFEDFRTMQFLTVHNPETLLESNTYPNTPNSFFCPIFAVRTSRTF